MGRYFCDYCDTYLTHDSPSVRKTHCSGRKHKDNVRFYYQKWMEDQAQSLIDATTAAFKAGKIQSNPFAKGVAIPPPATITAQPIRPQIGIPRPVMPTLQLHGVPHMGPPTMGPMIPMGPALPPVPVSGMRPPMSAPGMGSVMTPIRSVMNMPPPHQIVRPQ